MDIAKSKRNKTESPLTQREVLKSFNEKVQIYEC